MSTGHDSERVRASRHALRERIDDAWTWLARAQTSRPGAFLALALGLFVLALAVASRLELRTRFEQLLPEKRPSVVELKRLQENLRSGSHVFILIEGAAPERLRAFGDALAARLGKLGAPWVTDAEDGVQAARSFLEPRAGAFRSVAELTSLRDRIRARYRWEVGSRTFGVLDDEPPPLDLSKLRSEFGIPAEEPYPGGYYQSRDGKALVVLANTGIATGDLTGARRALDAIQASAEALRAAPEYRQLRLSYAGDLVTGLAEYGAVRTDLVSVGLLGVGVVLGIVLVYFVRLRALAALGLATLVGLSWTFALTELFIGYLNVATGFLVSIVAGNGINTGIIWLARCFEEQRRGRPLSEAVPIAHRGTWPATLAAAVAAMAAYGSLGVSEFRAFRHFAAIGAAGMLACWLASYLVLAPALVVIERRLPFSAARGSGWFSRVRREGVSFGAPLVWLVGRFPRALALGGVFLAFAGAFAIVPYLRSDPMEYDMRRMQNDLGDSGDMYRASKLSAEILGANLDGSMVMLADRAADVPELVRTLTERRDAAPPDKKPFEAVHSVYQFVPEHQDEKLPLLAEIRALVVRAHSHGFVSDGDFASIRPFLPPAGLAPWGVADLPASLVKPFLARDGQPRLALIEPTAGKTDADLHYLMRWADSFREVRLANGTVIHGSGRAVIFADMISTVLHDIPRSVVLSFAMTLLAIMITFRAGRHRLAVLAAWLMGLAWVALAVDLLHLKLNFFNFIALPVSFGIGVDYAVNLVQRYASEHEGGVLAALRSTGGAVVLCSLTTSLGYLALLGSINQAIRSLGLLAVLGEVSCLLAAVVALPALLLSRERTRGPEPELAESVPGWEPP